MRTIRILLIFTLVIVSLFSFKPTSVKADSVCTLKAASCGGQSCTGGCGQPMPGTYCGEGPDCGGDVPGPCIEWNYDIHGNQISCKTYGPSTKDSRYCNCWQWCCIVCRPGDCGTGPAPTPVPPTVTPPPGCGTCNTSNCSSRPAGTPCGVCSNGGGTCSTGTLPNPTSPPATPFPTVPPPGTASIIGRINITDPGGNIYITRSKGSTFPAGNPQCSNAPEYGQTVSNGQTTRLATDCNAGGPYYNFANLGTGTFNVSMAYMPNETWTWTCAPLASCAASGTGRSAVVRTTPGVTVTLNFTLASTPTCTISGPASACVGASYNTSYSASGTNGGINQLSIHGTSSTNQNWNQGIHGTGGNGTPILTVNNYSSGISSGNAVFDQPGTYRLVCNAFNTNTSLYGTGNPWCTGVKPSQVAPWATAVPATACQPLVALNNYYYSTGPSSITTVTAYNPVGSVGAVTLSQPTLGQILVSWAQVATNATGYTINRSANGGPYTFLATINNPALRSYTDSSIICDATVYNYQVVANSNVVGFPAACNNTTSASIGGTSCTSSWWQVGGGGNAIAATGEIKSVVPFNRYACIPTTSNVCGMGIGTSIFSSTSTNWAAATTTGGSTTQDTISSELTTKYTYTTLKARMYDLINTVTADSSSSTITLPGYLSGKTVNADGYAYIDITRSGNLTINGGNIGSNKAVIFVNGNVTISSNILVNHTGTNDGELVILANGSITLVSAVTTLEGVYFADTDFITGSGSALTVNGTVVGRNNVILNRAPAAATALETFNFVPQFITNFPSGLNRKHIKQELVAP